MKIETERQAIVDFAERVVAWTKYDKQIDHDAWTSLAGMEWNSLGCPGDPEDWINEQILAAARGERSLP